MGGVPLSWGLLDRTDGLVSYLSDTVGQAHGCLDSLVELARWSGLGTIFSSRWGYEWVSMPWPLWLIVWGLESGKSVHWIPWSGETTICPADGESHGLCSLFRCHCESSFWMGSAAPCVLWLGSLVGQTEGIFIQERDYELVSLLRCSGRSSSTADKALYLLS